MAFTQSFDNQSSDLRINVMIVDNDPVFLRVMSSMLENFKYRDLSTMKIIVIAVKDPIEALSSLRTRRHSINLIVTDYYMPRMNGLQLKKQINREFGDIPVIVMSSDLNKEQESLACGAMCFLPKPINPTDLPKIYQVALNYKRNDKSILWFENSHMDIDVCTPQQTQLLPEQANALKSEENMFIPRSDLRPVNSSNGSYVSTDGSGKNREGKPNNGSGDGSRPLPLKKPKIKWTDRLHDLFLQAIRHIGLDKAKPKKILEYMNLPHLTRENIASHLQKYRLFLQKVAAQGFSCSKMLPRKRIESIFLHAHLKDPYYNNYAPSSSWYDTSMSNRSFYSKPGQGYGQSRLLSNTAAPVRLNQITPYNHMNRSSTNEPRGIGSNLTPPTRTNINFPTQPSPNDGRRSLFEPIVVANKTGQTSQVMRFGQHGPSAINGDSFNNNMMSSYGSLTPNQPGINNYVGSTSNQPCMSSHASLTSTQPEMMNYGSLTPNQPRMNSYGISTSNQPGMKIHRSLTPGQQGIISYESLTSNQHGINRHGILSPNQPGLNSYGTTNSSRRSSCGISTYNQSVMNNHGSLPHGQHRMTSHASLSPNQPGLNSYGSMTHNAGPTNFSYGMHLFLNNENAAYEPEARANAATQPNLVIPQLENLDLYEHLSNIDEFPCDINNFQFDHNKQHEEAVSTTQFELPANLEIELNQILSLEENSDRNINQGHSDGETPNIVADPETNSPSFDMNPNHDEEQNVCFVDWSSLDKDLANEYDSLITGTLFANDMN